MTTYIYETVPAKAGEKPKYYEIKQNMADLPLFKHPETGEQIKRVVLGGLGVMKKADNGSCSGSTGCC